MAGCPGRSTALAMIVAAASAAAARSASTVTASAIPREKLRPRHPLVAIPRTGSAGMHSSRSQQRRTVGALHHPDHKVLAGAQVQRNISAIVHICARKIGGGDHRGQNLFRHCARHGRHGGNEIFAWHRASRPLPSSAPLLPAATPASGRTRPPQIRELAAQFVENRHKSRTGSPVRRLNFARLLRMPPRSGRSAHRADAVAARRAAIGFVRADSSFLLSLHRLERPRIIRPRCHTSSAGFHAAAIELSGRTLSTYPPSAA